MELGFPVVDLGPVLGGALIEIREKDFIGETKGAICMAFKVAKGNRVPSLDGGNASSVILFAD